jgi:uncharacterized Ntn-hydrolase superfamily protein
LSLILNTFSITAFDPATRQFGVAVSTARPAVGTICPFVRPGVGAIATQARANPYIGIDGLKLLDAGFSAAEAAQRLIWADPEFERRQFVIVDQQGQVFAHTGTETVEWAGHKTGEYFGCAGNMLTGPEVIEDMFKAYEAARTEGVELAERLIRALEAAQAAGGDKRGKQSAALKVVAEEEYPLYDLRVDEHSNPVAELRRVFEVYNEQMKPFVGALMKRKDFVLRINSED